MNILVANIGSTSLKYRLFAFAEDGTERMLARGGYERVTDYGAAIEEMLEALRSGGHLDNPEDIAAVGFKTVLGKDLSGCVDGDGRIIAALEGFADIAPAHNPPYAAGVRAFAEKLPSAKRIALFETAFYQWVPAGASCYAIPKAWRDLGIQRYGFHGASHKFIAERSAELLGRKDVADAARGLYVNGPTKIDGKPLRVISCHMGGSSSVTGIRNGVAVATSMGFSPQSGLPQNNRVGDLDAMAIPYAMEKLSIDAAEVERQLTMESGLLGLSGVSNDLRDILDAAHGGNGDAQLALDALIAATRHWIGALYFACGGADAIVFTAGIGENNAELRAAICDGLEDIGIAIDSSKNGAVKALEGVISSANATTKVLVIPTNEELVVAREAQRLLATQTSVA